MQKGANISIASITWRTSGIATRKSCSRAVAQMRQLNTNTRYLHQALTEFAERLTATLPDPLDVVYFTCSGSEANELALRIARAHTGRTGVVVLEAAYHGNTSALIEMSPYKHAGPGGKGAPPWVQVTALPDLYRGFHRGADAGERYAAGVAERVHSGDVAAFFVESAPGCGGQIILPPNYLQAAFTATRKTGALCVADEVQTGLGRAGSHFWMFETQGVVPDIVTIGKPLGNGHPMAAVVTTRAIARSFANGMEYFNTFGGNPVSCTIGLAVLDVIRDEQLQTHAAQMGEYLLAGLHQLAQRHPLIGDVRGRGLFLGVELVTNRSTRAPAEAAATGVINCLRERGVLLSTDGPLHNVLKIKPPMVFARGDADRLLEQLDTALATAGAAAK